jgi:aspartyl-tRNA(Asn)/glutamyl-tRNA(Gln) amidotransferase subunit A
MNDMVDAEIEAALERAQRDRWNCIARVLPERALRQKELLNRLPEEEASKSPLFGIPFVVKNSFDVMAESTVSGGAECSSLQPAWTDALLVQQLSVAGAVLVGTANMDEFACGFLGKNTHHGDVINPRDESRVTGGSSSGSAAAVAAGIVPFAVGTDTNGSIRVPAAFCQVYGLKPTFGRLPIAGVQPLAQSLDHPGLLANSMDLLEKVWSALTDSVGYDSTFNDNRTGFEDDAIGIAGADYVALSDDRVRSAYDRVRSILGTRRMVELRHVEGSFAAASLITAYEASAIHLVALEETPHRYSQMVATRLAAAASVTRSDYDLGKQYQAELARDLLSHFDAHGIRVLVTPCAPIEAPGRDVEKVTLAGMEVNVSDAAGLFTRPFSLAGFPAVTLPIKFEPSGDCALQLVARPGDEQALFDAARLIRSRVADRPVDH